MSTPHQTKHLSKKYIYLSNISKRHLKLDSYSRLHFNKNYCYFSAYRFIFLLYLFSSCMRLQNILIDLFSVFSVLTFNNYSWYADCPTVSITILPITFSTSSKASDVKIFQKNDTQHSFLYNILNFYKGQSIQK